MKTLFRKKTASFLRFVLFALTLITISCEKEERTKRPTGDTDIKDPLEANVATKSGLVITMYDDFEGDELNSEIWDKGLPGSWGVISLNDEKQGYVPENVFVADGNLVLEIKEGSVIGNNWNESNIHFDYTSGAVNTESKFYQKYGLFEMRAKLPDGSGTWPAFWLMPQFISNKLNTAGSEIDIVEHFTSQGNDIQMGLWWDGYGSDAKHWKTVYSLPTYSSTFNTYSCLWRPDLLSFYINNVLVGTYDLKSEDYGDGIPTTEEYIIINAALGGSAGGSINVNQLPDYFEVDYVKVYQFEDTEALQELEDNML